MIMNGFSSTCINRSGRVVHILVNKALKISGFDASAEHTLVSVLYAHIIGYKLLEQRIDGATAEDDALRIKSPDIAPANVAQKEGCLFHWGGINDQVH